jgi:(R)-benzylsuccinyl-CoA dehydrogenase
MKTRAEYSNGRWVINGPKIFISNARKADFIIVMAVTDPAKGSRGGITAFLVDQGTKGMSIPTVFSTIGEHAPYGVFFDNVEVSDDQVLGEVGNGFGPMQNRLGVRRMEIACRALGYARRCMELMIPYANERVTFGAPLADRQVVQWWIADSFQEMEMVRLITWRLACRIDQGEKNWRRDAAMVKLQGSEMIARVADRALQMFGGMGMTKDLPLEYISRACRAWRIYEGPSEVHRWFIARDLLRNGMPPTDA